jgi:hypothetical protein
LTPGAPSGYFPRVAVKPRRRGIRPRGPHCALAVIAAWLALPGAAAANHLDGFVFTFATPTASQEGWTLGGAEIDRSDTSVWSERYLGTFGEETVRLAGMDYLDTAALPPGRAYLSFDLILTGDWGGNGVFGVGVPDFESFFSVVANGQTLLDTTFSTESGRFGATQAYPGVFPQDSFPGRTGSVFQPDGTFLTVWHFDFDFQLTPLFPDCCTDVEIEFSALFGPGYDVTEIALRPRWGLDNVLVSSTPIPEPASAALLGLGLLALGARGRRVVSRRAAALRRGPPVALPRRSR